MKFKFDIISFALGMIYDLILFASVEPIRKKWRKECNYNCKNCKVWDCQYHKCKYLKDKLNDNLH